MTDEEFNFDSEDPANAGQPQHMTGTSYHISDNESPTLTPPSVSTIVCIHSSPTYHNKPKLMHIYISDGIIHLRW